MTPMQPIETRVGLILDNDNRFLGRSTYTEWLRDAKAPTDLWAAALGISVDNSARSVLRVLAVCLTSPDARVWPLKLTRLLSSHGDAAVGFFAAQLVSSGRTMGPGTVTGAAALLKQWALLDDDGRAALLATARAQPKLRWAGFGVPFRATDERLVALRSAIASTPAAAGRHWMAMAQLVDEVAGFSSASPNVILGTAALLLDLGVVPDQCGVGVSMLVSHMFLAHAVEASSTDAALQTLPSSSVSYAGPGPRSSR
jgi:hypothetical protein